MHPVLNKLLLLLGWIIISTLLILFFIPLFIYKCAIRFVVYLTRPEFGKPFSTFDTVLEETGIYFQPKCSLVTSLDIESSITLSELRRLFYSNVIQRKLRNGKQRYPELQQHPVSFMGYAYWRNVQFQIKDHIVERKLKNQDLTSLHQKMLNKSYARDKSPWEIVLINTFGGENKSLIISRFHHSLADAKSLLKLFVECLGNQKLTIAKAQQNQIDLKDKLLMPLDFVFFTFGYLQKVLKFNVHPLRLKKAERSANDMLPQLVKMSAKLSLTDVKEIGRRSGGTASSVILTIISGALKKLKPDMEDLLTAYVLPKENHPETLGNYAGFSVMLLPTGNHSARDRLEGCHKVFRKLKESNIGRYWDILNYFVSVTFNPVRRLVMREALSPAPIGITNIAGEGKGFTVGGKQCSEFIFSVGVQMSDAGIVFCTSSYMESLRIVIICREGILTEDDCESLALAMEEEFNNLKLLTLKSKCAQSE